MMILVVHHRILNIFRMLRDLFEPYLLQIRVPLQLLEKHLACILLRVMRNGQVIEILVD